MIYKRLLKSDVVLTPYEANKEFNFIITGSLPSDNCNTSQNPEFVVYTGKKLSTTFNKDTELQSYGQYQRLIYNHVNKLYYQKYTGSLDTGSKIDRFDIETLTNDRSTDKYQTVSVSEKMNKDFPINEGDTIRLIQISPKIISSKILENSINLSSSVYNLQDDGNGNLIDYSSSLHPIVGNVFYKTGNIVITNQDYVDLFPTPPTAFNKTYYFYENLNKSINLNDVIGIGTEALDFSSVNIITGSNSFNYNLSQSYLYITSSNVDDYYFTYNIQDVSENCSNYGRIDFKVIPNCDVTFSASFTSSAITTQYVHSFDCRFDVVKLPIQNCELINDIQITPVVVTGSVRSTGIKDYKYTFYSNYEGNWSVSKNGGVEYFFPFFSSSFFTGSTASGSDYSSNDFQGIIRFQRDGNYVEHYYKFDPVNYSPIVFEKINQYSNYTNYTASCYPSLYQVIGNGEPISDVNYTTTGDVGIFAFPDNKVSVIGTKGSFSAHITGSDSHTCIKTVYINGNAQTDCLNELTTYIGKTNIPNRYFILADTTNKYLSTYPQFTVKSGSIEFKSSGNSLYNEFQVLDSTGDNILNFYMQDFCGKTFSKDFILPYDRNITGSLIFGDSYNKLPTTIAPTTVYYPPTTQNNTTRIDYVNLKLNQVVDNTSVANNSLIKVSLSVTNTGQTDATNVEVRNILTSSLHFDSALSVGVRYTSSLVSAILPRVRVNETVGFDYKLLVTGSYSSSFENKAQIFYVDQPNTGSVIGNGYDNNEIDEAKVMITILPSGSSNPTGSEECINFVLTNNTGVSQSYFYYDCNDVYKSGSLDFQSGTNTVSICTTSQNKISVASSVLIDANGICTNTTIVNPVIESVIFSCDCGNQFFDNTQNAKGRIFVTANNPNGDDADLQYSFLGDIDNKYQNLPYSDCLPNGLYTVYVRLKSDKTKKVSQRVVIYCGNVTESCNTYRIINDTSASVQVDYINCSGENISYSITGSSNYDVCTRNREYIMLSDDLLTIEQIGNCVTSTACDIQITSINPTLDSIEILASGSVDLAYTIDGGWTWYNNSGSFDNLENGNYLVGVASNNDRNQCFTNYQLVTLGVSSSVTPRIDFYQVFQDKDMQPCNQFESYIYCCITPHGASGMYQYKIVDKLNNRIVYDWTSPSNDTVSAFLVNHGTYQVLVRDSNNIYCQNMFDDLEVSFANCL